jgi:hypothetical protein
VTTHRSQSSNLEGIKVALSAPVVNHLLIVDDSLLLFKVSEGDARWLCTVWRLGKGLIGISPLLSSARAALMLPMSKLKAYLM